MSRRVQVAVAYKSHPLIHQVLNCFGIVSATVTAAVIDGSLPNAVLQ
jgi:hypothetical protein